MARRHYRPTLADAFTAHDEALRYGGREGVASLALIESALARPFVGYHRSMPERAAALLHGMVKNHGFVDGNKRTGWLVVELLIERSGYRLNIPSDAPIDNLVVSVAADEISFNELVRWFREHLRRTD